MSKLPNIFHNNDKFLTNNKNSFTTFEKQKESKNEELKKDDTFLIDSDSLINYFNQKIVITLKDGSVYSGVLLSKRDNKILLDSNVYISINDIIKIS